MQGQRARSGSLRRGNQRHAGVMSLLVSGVDARGTAVSEIDIRHFQVLAMQPDAVQSHLCIHVNFNFAGKVLLLWINL